MSKGFFFYDSKFAKLFEPFEFMLHGAVLTAVERSNVEGQRVASNSEKQKGKIESSQ